MRPVRVLGKQPGVFMSFALISLACQYLKRESLAIVSVLAGNILTRILSVHAHTIDLVSLRQLRNFCLEGELGFWAASCVHAASTLDLNLYIPPNLCGRRGLMENIDQHILHRLLLVAYWLGTQSPAGT